MNIPCKHCSCSGTYIGWAGYPTYDSTGRISGGTVALNCRFCNGKGWINEDELITVPRKYIKDEYFKQ